MTYALDPSFPESFGTWGGATQLERRSFSQVLWTLRASRDVDRRAEAVEWIVNFFERTRARRLTHWRKLAAEVEVERRSGIVTIPTDRARPPIVAAAGAAMARKFAEERKRARAAIEAATGGQWRSARPDVRASQRSLASRLPD